MGPAWTDDNAPASEPAKPRNTPATPQAVPSKSSWSTEAPLGEIDLNQPLPELAPGAAVPTSNWSGKKKGWKDVPTWVWAVRGGVAMVVLLVVAQLAIFLIKLALKEDADPSKAGQVAAVPSSSPSSGSAPLAPAQGDPPAQSGVSSRPLANSQPAATSTPATAVSPIVSTNPSTSPAKSWVSVTDNAQDAIVMITTVDSLGREQTAGSGFVIDSSGLVATNFHVLAKAHVAKAQLRNGITYPIAGYRAFDVARDLAIVQLSNLPVSLNTLKLQPAAAPEPGAEVITFGNPSDFKPTYKSGVVSKMQTTADLPAGARHFLKSPDDNIWIETTAVMPGGNTGGPLLNRLGEVIGINTWSAEGQKVEFATHARHLLTLFGQLRPEVATFDKVNSSAAQWAKLKQRSPQVAAVMNDFRTDYEAFNEELKSQTKQNRSQQQIAQFVATRNPISSSIDKLFALADRNRKTDIALDALDGICELLQLPGAHSVAVFKRATDRVIEDHADDPKLGPMLADMTRLSNEEAILFLRQITQKSKEPLVCGPACYLLARELDKTQPLPPAREAEVVALLERTKRDFSEVLWEAGVLGKAADSLLFEVQNLSVGKQAPEIFGRDVTGGELKLSDYHGKVVVLDFFADWCPSCTNMYLQERGLVEQFKGKLFALLGVSLDQKERLQYVLNSQSVTWRCWWDGPTGPIAARWNIQTVPTMFVLDRKGIIRYKYVGNSPSDLPQVIQQLLQGNDSLPAELQPVAGSDLQTQFDKLSAAIGSQSTPTVVNAALILIQSHRSKVTRQHLNAIDGWISKGLEGEPDSISLLFARARLQEFQGHTPEAVQQLRGLLKRTNLEKSQSVMLKKELAYLLVVQGENPTKDAPEAMVLIDEAIFEAGGGNPEMLDTRAMAYMARNMFPEARADMAAVLSQGPKPLAYFHQALIEAAASNVPAAADALQRALVAGLNPAQLSSHEQKQLQRLARSLNVPLKK